MSCLAEAVRKILVLGRNEVKDIWHASSTLLISTQQHTAQISVKFIRNSIHHGHVVCCGEASYIGCDTEVSTCSCIALSAWCTPR